MSDHEQIPEKKEEAQENETSPRVPEKDGEKSNEESKPDDGIDYWKEFQLGVFAVFRKWTAIRMAVDRGWGGRNSAEKEQILIQSVIDLLDTKPDLDRLLDLLEQYLPENFSVVIEDDSTLMVGDDIWDIYCTCAEGDNSLARKAFDLLSEKEQRDITDFLGLTQPEAAPEPTPVPEPVKEELKQEEDDDGWTTVSVASKPKNKKKNKK